MSESSVLLGCPFDQREQVLLGSSSVSIDSWVAGFSSIQFKVYVYSSCWSGFSLCLPESFCVCFTYNVQRFCCTCWSNREMWSIPILETSCTVLCHFLGLCQKLFFLCSHFSELGKSCLRSSAVGSTRKSVGFVLKGIHVSLWLCDLHAE